MDWDDDETRLRAARDEARSDLARVAAERDEVREGHRRLIALLDQEREVAKAARDVLAKENTDLLRENHSLLDELKPYRAGTTSALLAETVAERDALQAKVREWEQRMAEHAADSGLIYRQLEWRKEQLDAFRSLFGLEAGDGS